MEKYVYNFFRCRDQQIKHKYKDILLFELPDRCSLLRDTCFLIFELDIMVIKC